MNHASTFMEVEGLAVDGAFAGRAVDDHGEVMLSVLNGE